MASLVLGAAGAFVGSFFGPIGASIGWSLGSALGSALDPEKIQGPRLTDLKLQASQYGTMIPIVYGSARLTGQVIWQTDLIEHRNTTGGKGGPVTHSYTYSASFAIQLCEGEIEAVSRVWADGRLIHDTTSYDDQSVLPFVVYRGTEDQLPDPSIEADKGAGNVPAHRGYAYVVLTDVDMSEFGNRLPNFSFEILTTTDQTVGLHEVKRVDGLAVEWEHGYGGVGIPWITSWPGSGSGQIVIKNMTIGGGHDYNNPDLTYSGSTNNPGPNEFNVEVWGPGLSISWMYQSVGYVLIHGVECPLWVHPPFVTNLSNVNAALVGSLPYSADGSTVTTDREVAVTAGIPAGLYIGGITVSTNKTTFLVFTAATYGGAVDHWYRIVDGDVTDDGAVTPTQAFGFLGYGSWANDELQINGLENNGEWMWHIDSDDDEAVTVWHIDPVTGIFAVDATAGALSLDDGNAATKPTLRVIKDGSIGVAISDTLLVVSRLPTYAALGTPLSDVVADLCARAGLAGPQIEVDQLADDYVQGYAIASQGQVRSAIGQLQAGYFFDVAESEDVLRFVKRDGEPVGTFDADDLAAAGDSESLPALLGYTRQQETELPRVVAVNFVNFDDDYQQGTQSAKRDTTISEMESAIGLAIVMKPQRARRISDMALYMSWIERDRFTISVPRKYAHYEPSDKVIVENWTLRLTTKTEQPNGVIKFDAVATSARTYIPASGGVSGSGFVPGRPPIKQHTDLMLLDIPLIDDDDAVIGYYVAVAGQISTAWSGCVLFQSKDGGTTYAPVANFITPSIMGTALTVLPDHGGINVFDEASTVSVELTPGVAGTLESLSETLVLSGANMALIGNEVVQYKNAVLTGTRTYTLSGFLRGRRGSEWAMQAHVAQERFVLLSSAYDQVISPADIGQEHLYKAVTQGATLAATATLPFTYHAVRVRPYAPSTVGGGADSAGNVTVNWIRRTRVGGAWLSFSDVPLGENVEEYVVEVWDSSFTNCARTTTVTVQNWLYTAAMQVTDFGVVQRFVYVTIGQVGSYGLGYRATGIVTGLPGGTLNSPVLVPIVPYPVDWQPPPSGTTVDQNHMANFTMLMGTDRQLAYKYATLGPVFSDGWYQRMQFVIVDTFFGGDTWAWARWVQDAEYNRPVLTPAELTYLFDLAYDAMN